MRILVYGFGPYRKFQRNVTESIVRRLPRRHRLYKIIFPVQFNKTQFLNSIGQYRPDVVLGLGQCSRGRRLRIEAQAVNKRRRHKREKAQPIVTGGALRLATNLRFDLGAKARVSHNAGDYVCNYSMYVILDFLRRRRAPIRFGFIHVPCGYEAATAVRVLAKAIGRITPAI
jgi:pyroglutamyl-peptidase